MFLSVAALSVSVIAYGQPVPVIAVQPGETSGPFAARYASYTVTSIDTTAQEVLAIPRGQWQSGEGISYLTVPRTSDAVWARFELRLPAGERYVVCDRHGFDDISFYIINRNGEPVLLDRAGWQLSASDRDLYSPFVAVEIPASGRQTLLVRVATSTTIQFALYAIPVSRFERMRFADILIGVGPSVALLMLGLLAWLISWRTRDQIYAWYGGFMVIIAFLIAYISGVGSLAIWNGSAFFNRIGVTYAPLAAWMLLLGFALRYLGTRGPAGRLRRFLLWVFIVEAVLFVAAVFLVTFAPVLAAMVTGMNQLVLPAVVIVSLIVGAGYHVPHTGFLLACWSTLFAAGIYYLLRFLLVVPASIAMDRVSIYLFLALGLVFAGALAEKLGFIRRLTAAATQPYAQSEDAEEQIIRLQRMAALGERAGDVGHEFRNAIGNVRVVATNLITICDRVISREATVDDAKAGVAESGHLLGDTLDRATDLASSIQAEVKDLATDTWTEVDLCRLCSDIVRLKSLQLKYSDDPSHRTHTIAVECNGPVSVVTVPAYLTQILINLIDNAIFHGFEGRTDGSIIVTVAPPGSDTTFALQVADNGVGIDPEVQSHMFDRFFTTGQRRGGGGFGMHIVKRLITALGGSIAVESAPGEGATFRMVFQTNSGQST